MKFSKSSMRKRILIVDDDVSFGTMLKSWFRKNDFEAELSSNISQAKKEYLAREYHLVLTDLRMPDGDGIMLLSWIKEQKKPVPVIVMTSYGQIQSAVSAMKLGAFDYLEKPLNPTVLKQKIDQALGDKSHIEKPPISKINKSKSSGNVVGKSHAAAEMDRQLLKVAPTFMSVIVLGESGTGKEYAARRIHEFSKQKKESFIAVDCGSLSKELAPSELFGHLKGAFTSAVADKKGVFEQANGGTVFLDEIGNLSYDVQVQLLRCLQERKVRPVGSTKDIDVDVRIIVATNENLLDAISQGKFREDLYHRLNEFSIKIPPLRERKEDIGLFAMHFLEQANQELSKDIKGFSDDTMQILNDYYWGGNLREMRNVVRRAALFAEGDEIIPVDLPILSVPLLGEELALKPGNEKEQIETALKRVNGNKTLAAKILKIDRKTLYNMMHRLELNI